MAIKRTILNTTESVDGGGPSVDQLRDLLGDRFSSAELAAMTQYGSVVTVDQGSSLTTEGAVGSEAFILVEGQADVLRAGESIATAVSGDIIGEHALITEGRRDADVIATSPVSALAYTSREFAALLAACPDLSTSVQGLAAERAE